MNLDLRDLVNRVLKALSTGFEPEKIKILIREIHSYDIVFSTFLKLKFLLNPSVNVADLLIELPFQWSICICLHLLVLRYFPHRVRPTYMLLKSSRLTMLIALSHIYSMGALPFKQNTLSVSDR